MEDHRDILSEMQDDFLLKILSHLSTKDVMVTSLLSKRWCFLWKLVPRLSYDLRHHDNKYLHFARFVDRSLLLHKVLVLESLHIKIVTQCDVDIGIWIRTAIERCVRELNISLYVGEEPIGLPIRLPIRLPKCLYTCTTLVVLKLENISLLDISYVCFQSLKTLHLVDVKYLNEQSLPLLLSNCYRLEDLVLQRCPGDNVKVVTIALPYLQTLSIERSSQTPRDDDGFLIIAPSLERLNLEDNHGGFCSVEDMPELIEANIDIIYDNTENLMGSLTRVKRLSLCLVSADAAYPSGTIFSQLVQLEICLCQLQWCDLLTGLVHDSPNLRFLKLHLKHNPCDNTNQGCWKQPVSVQNCFLSHLETFEWKAYDGTKVQKEVAIYVLRHAICLKKAIFFPKPTISLQEKYEMLKQLATSPRASTTCELFFD